MNSTSYNEMNMPIRTAAPNSFAIASRTLGIISLLCMIMGFMLVSLICGALAIILAVLSRGSNRSINSPARIGLICGTVGVAVELFVLLVQIYAILFIPQVREQYNMLYQQMYEQLYGKPTEENPYLFYENYENMDIPRVEGGDL